MKFEKDLESIGLSSSEAKIYLTNLSLGPASAIQLAQKLGITRQSIYELLPRLMEKGLIKQVQIGTRRYFQAVNPDVLRDRAKLISEKVEEIIPQLKSRQADTNAVPLISVYENPLSMREWYTSFMEQAGKGDQMLIWSTGNLWYELDSEFYTKFAEFKNKNEVQDLVIAPNTPEARQIAQQLASPLRQYRFTSEWWLSSAEMWVWNNQIVYLTLKENATNMIVIESDALAAIERFNFRNVWSHLKR
jgi:sugar-specific transcriptional regulator TrmB